MIINIALFKDLAAIWQENCSKVKEKRMQSNANLFFLSVFWGI